MEILSPAGSFAALEAAVHYGADAVYVGGARFSARKNAQNFTDEELMKAVDFCHVRGVKVYLCCNTLMKESELDDAMAFIRYAYEIGVDALIVQDLGLLSRIRQELPEMPVHGSTQMTVTNSDGVNLLADLGVKRVVLAREVTGKELSNICRNTNTELEYFVHGALCISYSGQCLMSSLLGGRSGNRGGCAQPCRLPYTLLKNNKPVTEKQALLCPKDLCLADRVQELAAMGVTSLKIEGRMKSPEYVAMVTRVYKQAVAGNVSNEEIQDMLKFFSRGGSCNGYFDGCSYSSMMDSVGNAKIASALPVLEKQVRKNPVSLSFYGHIDKPLKVSASSGGKIVTVCGEVCEKAHTRPTEPERIREQLAKLGETPFYAESIDIQVSDNAAIPIKSINALRRQAVDELEKLLAQQYRRSIEPSANRGVRYMSEKHKPALCVEVMTKEQLHAAVDMGIDRIYLPLHLAEQATAAFQPVLQLAPITSEGQTLFMGDAKRVCIQNLGQLSASSGREITAGHRLNITNAESAEQLLSLGVSRVVVSPELNLKGIYALRRHTDMELEVIGYGRLPLMLLKNCIIKSAGTCGCDSGEFAIQDRKNEIFPLLPLRCGNVVYNSKSIYMADRMEDIKNLQIDGIRLSFTLENYERCCIIIREYQDALAGKTVRAPEGDFTRGHFYRGMQ